MGPPGPWPALAALGYSDRSGRSAIYIPTTLALKSWIHGMELIEMSVIVWEVRRGRPGWPPPVCPESDSNSFFDFLSINRHTDFVLEIP